MRVQITCPRPDCGRSFAIDYAHDATSIPCPHCGHGISLDPTAINPRDELTHCLCCRCDELFLRKDFPQKIGLFIVIAAACLSIVFFARGRLLESLGILLAVVIVDLIIYAFVPRITVCYRCRATFREFAINPDHRGFDLATAEKYRGTEMQ